MSGDSFFSIKRRHNSKRGRGGGHGGGHGRQNRVDDLIQRRTNKRTREDDSWGQNDHSLFSNIDTSIHGANVAHMFHSGEDGDNGGEEMKKPTHITFNNIKKQKDDDDDDDDGENGKDDKNVHMDPVFLSGALQMTRENQTENGGFQAVKLVKLPKKCIATSEELSFMPFLERIELNGNVLRSLQFLAENRELKHVNVAKNNISDLSPLRSLRKIEILNVSHNNVVRLPENLLSHMTQLKALVLNDNQMTRFPTSRGVALEQLNTLIVKKNEIEEMNPAMDREFPQMKKISAGNNLIRAIPTCVGNMLQLQELLLPNNRIMTLPDCIGNLDMLKTVQLNNNYISSFDEVAKLKICKRLRHLHLAGNPIQKNNADSYKEKILEMFPRLWELDGVPLREKKKKGAKEEEKKSKTSKDTKHMKQNASDDTMKQKKKKKPQRSDGETAKTESKRSKGQKKDAKTKRDSVEKSAQKLKKQSAAIEKKVDPSNAAIDALFVDDELTEDGKRFSKKVDGTNVVIDSLADVPSMVGTFGTDPTSGFVNVQEEKEEKRSKLEETGGFAQAESKFSGIVDSRPTKRRRQNHKKKPSDVIGILLQGSDESIGSGESGW